MAIFAIKHTLHGKDASYMEAKLEAILGASAVSSKMGGFALPYVDPKVNVYLDPALDTTQTIDKEGKITLAKLIQNYQVNYPVGAGGGTSSVWDGLVWIFLVPDAQFAAASAAGIIAAIKAIA